MILSEAAWGLDVTGGAFKAVRLERKGHRILVTSALDIPYAVPADRPGRILAHLPRELDRIVREFVSDHAATLGDPIYVGMHGYGATVGELSIPSLRAGPDSRLLDFELRDVLREDPANLVIRTEATLHRRADDRVRYYAQRRSLIDTVVADLRRANLPLDGLVPEGLAAARFLTLEWPGRDRRVAVQLHRQRTDLIYLSEHAPRFRTLPVGLCSLTGFVAGARTPDPTEVQDLVTTLHAEHRRARTRFFGSADSDERERLLVLGEGASIPAVLHAFGRIFAREPATLTNLRKIRVSSRLSGGVALDVAQMGTALGLALSGIRRRAERFSLIPLPRQRRRRRRGPALAVSCLIFVVALLALRWQAHRQRRNLEEFRAQLGALSSVSTREEVDRLLEEGASAALGHEELVWRAAALRRQSTFPRALFREVGGPTAWFRLVRFSFAGGREFDEVEALFEVPRGLAGAVNSVETWVSEHWGIAVGESASEGKVGDDLRIRVRGTLGRREPP